MQKYNLHRCHISSVFDVEFVVVSICCGADKESAVADGAVVEALSSYQVEYVVSVMFVLACGWDFWCVTHAAAAAEEVSILSRNDCVVLVIVFGVLFSIVCSTMVAEDPECRNNGNKN